MYQRGLGVQQSTTEAEKWFQKAALQGNAGAKASLAALENQEAKRKTQLLEDRQRTAEQLLGFVGEPAGSP